MAKFSFERTPLLAFLTPQEVERVHEEALKVLEKVGVYFDSEEALRLLAEAGCEVDKEKKIAKFPSSLVVEAIAAAPEKIAVFDREGDFYAELGDNTSYFDPGSGITRVLLEDGVTVRDSTRADMKAVAKIVDFLPQIEFQSTALVCSDAPYEVADLYRLYLVMKESKKPVITGAFSVPGVRWMRELLRAVRGSYEEVEQKPYAIFDICPSPPLKWTHMTAQNIIDCARFGLPIEFISVPMLGATSPATIIGSVVQDVAETLSGLTLAQVVRKGAPVIYGGAPVVFDMRTATPLTSAMEAVLVSCACAQVAKYYGLPTHCYTALSDAKIVDAQAGFETALGGVLAALAGINVISGVGALDFMGTLSLEKLVIDAEIVGMIKRVQRGILVNEETLAAELFPQVGPGGDFLSTKHTRQWFKKEQYLVSAVVDRKDRRGWEQDGRKDIFQRARQQVEMILKNHPGSPLAPEKERSLEDTLRAVAREAGVEVAV